MSAASARPAAPPSFEEAMAKLEQITRSLENGQLPLDAAITAYEEGVKLQAFCQDILNSAKLRVEAITSVKADGSWETTETAAGSLLPS
jgi:exodeoxyribonuclease VII small subunit